MSDNRVEPIRQETEADGPSQAAPGAKPKDRIRPRYIQALGGAMVFAGTFMTWVIVSGPYSLLGTQIFTGLPMLLVGALIVLAAPFASNAPSARGSWVAALLGLLVFGYMGIYAYGVIERNSTVGVGAWVCLLGGSLAFAGGWMKNPGVKPHSSTTPLQVRLKAWALALGIIVLATLLGGFVPYVIVKIQENSYQKMFSFPDQAAQIRSGDYKGLYISTVEGKVLFCDISIKPTPCNEIALENVPATPTSQLGQRPCLHRFSPPPAPGNVIASYESCTQYIEGLSQTDWVILNDGSVWSWKVNCNMMGCSYDPGLRMVLGGIVGFLAGVVIVAALGSRRKSREGKITETNASAAPADEGTTPWAQASDAASDEDVWECEVCGAVVEANATVCSACGAPFED